MVGLNDIARLFNVGFNSEESAVEVRFTMQNTDISEEILGMIQRSHEKSLGLMLRLSEQQGSQFFYPHDLLFDIRRGFFIDSGYLASVRVPDFMDLKPGFLVEYFVGDTMGPHDRQVSERYTAVYGC